LASFSTSLEQALRRALQYANERSHEYATLEHLLLALVDDRDAAAVMRACAVDLDVLRDKLVTYLDNELASLVTDTHGEAQPTAGFQRVIHRAVAHVQSSGREEVTGASVLVAVFAERESHAAFFLQEQNMTRFDAVNYISHGIAKRAGMTEPRAVRGVDEDAATVDGGEEKKRGLDALEVYHSDHDEAAIERYRQMASDLGLLMTGGSDFHGDPMHGIEPGASTLPPDEWARLSAARRRHAAG